MLEVAFIYAMGWLAGAMTVYLHLKYKADMSKNEKPVRPEDLRPKR